MALQVHGRRAAWALAAALLTTSLTCAALAQDSPDTAANAPASANAAAGQAPQAAQPRRHFGPQGRGLRQFGEYRQFREFQQFRDWQRWQTIQHRRAGADPTGARRTVREGGLLVRPMLGTFRRLELSDTQWQQVRTILAGERPDQHRGARTPATSARWQSLADPGSAGHASALQSVKDRAAARLQRAVDLQQRLYQVLTPQQKTRLTQLLAQRGSAASKGGEGRRS